MRNLFTCLSVTLAIAGLVSEASAQENVKAILEKAVKAHGGKENLAKMNAISAKSEGKLEFYGGLNFTQESTSNLPKQFKETITLEINGSSKSNITVFDDGKAWMNVDGKTTEFDAKMLGEIKEASNLMQLGSLHFVDAKDYTVTPLGESKVNDKPVVGVKVARQGFRDASLFFSKDTGLLSMISSMAYDVNTMKDTLEERLILSYQDVNGLKVAKKILVKHDGKKFLEAEVTEFKLLDKVDPAVFAKP